MKYKTIRYRLFCEFKGMLEGVFRPCRKVLGEIIAREVKLLDKSTVEVSDLECIHIKCARPGCKHITTIQVKSQKEGTTNGKESE